MQKNPAANEKAIVEEKGEETSLASSFPKPFLSFTVAHFASRVSDLTFPATLSLTAATAFRSIAIKQNNE